MTYNRTNWVDYPDLSTPINAARLNNMEAGIAGAIQPGNAQIVDADVAPNAAIQYSKLALALQILDGDISPAAAIAISKLAGYPGDALKLLHGDGSWSPLPSGVLTYRKSTVKAVTNTITETDLLNSEITLPANTLTAGKFLRLTAAGDCAQGAAGSFQRFRFKLGATTLFDTNTIGGANTGATRGAWRVQIELLAQGASLQWLTFQAFVALFGTAASAATVKFTTGNGFVTTQPANAVASVASYDGTGPGTIDSTQPQVVALTVVNGTATATDTTLQSALLEVL